MDAGIGERAINGRSALSGFRLRKVRRQVERGERTVER